MGIGTTLVGPTSDVITSTWGHMEIVAAETEFLPGEKMTLTAASSCTAFGAVFEDDGDTGYFYALDTSNPDHQILDALLVYNVTDVTDRQKSSRAQVVWSADGLRVILRINGHPHAAFDFAKGRGYCRTNFPPPSAAGFSSESHAWSDDVLAFFE